MVIVASFDVKIENVTDVMTLCIPFSSLQPHLEALSDSNRSGGQSDAKQLAERTRLHHHLSEAEVEASAVFRAARATSRQVVDLEVGDILLFNHPIGMPLVLETGGVPIYDVTIGRVSRHLALQVAGAVPRDRQRRRSRLQVIRSTAA
jgi:flagellar motor switch protein FliM